jgi:membrane protease YdiL (CAAX protease family)
MNTIAEVPTSQRLPLRAIVLALLFIAGGIAIFVFGSPFYTVFSTNDNPIYNAVLVLVFGLLVLGLRRSTTTVSYAPAAYALFIAAAANLVLVIGPLNSFLSEPSEPYRLLAQDKLLQLIYVVPIILVLNWIARRDFGTIYLQRGQPRRWLTFGLVWFFACAVVMAAMSLGSGVTAGQLAAYAPYILVFVIANAFMEELWFRGIFLRPYSSLVGSWGAILVTALVFGASHLNVSYIGSGLGWLFGLVVLAIGLVTAWAIRWAGSLWGAVLFHMGMDLLIVLPIIQSLGV